MARDFRSKAKNTKQQRQHIQQCRGQPVLRSPARAHSGATQRQQEPCRANAGPVRAAQGQRKPREGDASPFRAVQRLTQASKADAKG